MSEPRRVSSVRLRLLSIVVAAVVPALVLVGVQATLARQDARADAEAQLLELTHVLANHQQQLIDDTELLLAGLARLPEVTAYRSADCNKTLDAFWQAHPKYTGFGVLDPDGFLWCSAQPTATLLNLSHLPHFQRVRATQAFAVGDFTIGQVSGLPTLPMGYPILDGTGRLAAVLATALGTEWATETLEAGALPPDASAGVIDDGGVIVARIPEIPGLVGNKTPAAPAIFAALARGDPIITVRGADGVVRIVAAEALHVHGTDLGYVSVGATPGSIYGDVYDELERNLLAVLAVSAIAAAVAWVAADRIVGRPARRLEATSRRLQAGELQARAGNVGGGAELQRVGEAIDRLAATVQAQLDDLRRANEMKTDLINRVSHELATPLTPLRAQLAVLERTDAAAHPAKLQASVAALRRNTDRLSAIVGSILDAAAVQAGALSYNPTSFDLAALLRRAVEPLPAGTVRVEAPELLAVRGDPEQVGKVLRGLLDNARRHAGGNPITVRAAAVGPDALLEVTDHGTGLAPEQLERLFHPFSQVHDPMQENRPGAGMTLYVAHAIIASHGGRIWAASPGKGQGTTVSFTVPLAKTDA